MADKPIPSPNSSSEQFATRIDAPSRLARGMWTVDQIPAGRLIAPLVVLDVTASVKNNPDYEISVRGHRSLGASQWADSVGRRSSGAHRMGIALDFRQKYRNADGKGRMHFPGYSEDAARFLAEGRNALGLGIDTPNLDHGAARNSCRQSIHAGARALCSDQCSQPGPHARQRRGRHGRSHESDGRIGRSSTHSGPGPVAEASCSFGSPQSSARHLLPQTRSTLLFRTFGPR